MEYIGMDPSYNGFAISIINENGDIIQQHLLKSKSEDEVEDRILYFEDMIQFLKLKKYDNPIHIEGPSYSSKGAFVLQMGALHFYLRIFFRKNNIPYKIITPNELKKFVSGKGNCKKELMLLHTYKKWGVEFSDNNLCDAYGLARYAQTCKE